MSHTRLVSMLQDACSVAGESVHRQVPVEQVIEERLASAEAGMTRRGFLGSALIVGVAATAPALLRAPLPVSAATTPRIAIVGAGLAGLTAAYRLKQAGYSATVYEASDRVGGRCWTNRSDFADGQIVEHGGELIDNNHIAIKQLAQELGLVLDNLYQAEKKGTEALNYFDGTPYTYTQATNDIKAIWQKIHSDVSAASYPTVYNSYTPRGLELDQMSIIDWINESVPGGLNSKLGQLLDIAYNIEYGGESSVQSSLNLLYLLGYKGQGQLRIFGPSNEKFHVRGGNDQVATRMAAAVAGQIETNQRLIAVRQNADGTFKLTFQSGAGTKDVVADKVVLTVPFAVLRSDVNLTQAGFKPLKMTAIREMGMGTNTKMHVQFTDRHWESLGCSGETYADTGYQNTWEVSRAQAGAFGILVNYTGGNVGASFSSGTPAKRAAQFLQQIEPVLPGITPKWNGRVTVDYWTGNRNTRGSYSYWKVGQYTKFAGVESEREGHCHFAGEHTSLDFQGYLNGAVESGERAVAEILADFKSAGREKNVG